MRGSGKILPLASQVALAAKNTPANAGAAKDAGWIPGLEDPLAKEVAIHSSILLGESPWTEALYSP